MRNIAIGLFTCALFGAAPFTQDASAQALSTLEPGYALGSLNSFTDLCGTSLSTEGLSDGTFIAFDGQNVDVRTAGGIVFRRLATLPLMTFPSFVEVSPDETVVVFGESSNGTIWSVDLTTGAVAFLTSLSFNFDLAFDVDPNFAYVSAASGGFGVNSVHRLDLMSGMTVEVATVTGFSGPIAVNDDGDVLLGRLPDVFPFPADDTELLLFSDAALDTGTLLTDADALVITPGLDSMSSLEFDHGNGQMFLMETNTGTTGFGSRLWRLDEAGTRLDIVVEADEFSGGVELVDSGVGTKFGAYQPPYSGLRYTTNACFGAGISERITVRGRQPRNVWSGPPVGLSDQARFSLSGGVPDGFAVLWAARSNTFQSADLITSLGGFYPLALRANATDFIRRFPPTPIDGNGDALFEYFQNASIEGGFIGQWIIFDSAMNPITTSNAAVNR